MRSPVAFLVIVVAALFAIALHTGVALASSMGAAVAHARGGW
jgi:hypothetical protein